MKYRAFISIGLLLITLASGAQSKYGIRRTDAFFTEHMPGNIRANDNGEPAFHGPDTITTIYIETTSNAIKWITAWKDGKSFSVSTTAINERPYEVGVN